MTQIWDPNGNKYQYTYSTLSGNSAETVLTSITAPDGAVTNYQYDYAVESDLTPADLNNGTPVDKYHLDVHSITDPRQKTYTFSYQFDQTKWDFDSQSNIYFPQTGAPRNVSTVILPDSTGTSTFSNNSHVSLTYSGTNLVLTGSSHRQIQVTDAVGKNITYKFGVGAGASQVFTVAGLPSNSPPPKIIFYTNMEVDYGTLGSELFTFDPTAGLALASVRDFSGNTTTYSYGDAYSGAAFSTTFGAYPGFFSKYEDPTLQTNALSKSKTFHYGAYRMMDQAVDENGHLKTYLVDGTMGRRLNEIVYSGSTTASTVVQETDFAYSGAFQGVVTQKTVKNLSGPSWATDLDTQYVLDASGRVAQEIVDPSGLHLVTKYTYDSNGNKLSATDPRSYTTWFSYDLRNRLITITYFDGTEKQIYYDARGNKTSEVDENGHATLFHYDALNRIDAQAKDMNGNGLIDSGDLVTQFGYNAVNSKTSVQDPNDNVTVYQYDDLQRLSTNTLNASSAFNDPITQRLTQYFYDGQNPGGSAFDSSSFKPTRIIDPRGFETDISYDALYRMTDKTVTYAPGASAHTHWEYDFVGNQIEQDLPADINSVVRQSFTQFDALNRPTLLTHEDGKTTQFFYTSTGLKWRIIDERNNATDTQFDGAGRPVLVITPPVDDGTGVVRSGTTQTIFDAAGNVSATINPLLKQWDYAYNSRNRKTDEWQPSVYDALSGIQFRPHLQWAYDGIGNVRATTDAKQQTTNKFYDPANRLVEIKTPAVPLPDGTMASGSTSMAYDGNGNVTQLTDPNGHATTNTYNALNGVLTTTDAANIQVINGYDEAGNRTSVQDGKQQTTTFSYDGLNRNTGITDPASRSTTFGFDGLNKTSRTDSNGSVTQYGYDLRNRLLSVTYSGRTSDNRTYGYDFAGNLTSVTEPGKNGLADVGYTYDALNRQITETSGSATHTYTYDLAGNRLKAIYGGTGRTLISTFDALNRLSTLTEGTRVTSYFYDLNGNSVLKLTVATYQRPSGKNIHRFKNAKESDEWGVSPDPGLELKLTPDQYFAYARGRRQRDLVSNRKAHPAAAATPEPAKDKEKPKDAKDKGPDTVKMPPQAKPFVDLQRDKALRVILDELAEQIMKKAA